MKGPGPKLSSPEWKQRLPLMLIALVLAFVVHFAAEAERQAKLESQKSDHAEMVELKVSGPDRGIAATGVPDTVEVRVRGPVGAEMPSTVKARADLSGRRAGEWSAPITVSLPKGWTLIEVRPQVLRVKLEQLVSRAFVVTPVVPKGGAGPVEEFPIQCTVQGPSSQLKQVRAVIAMYSPDDPGPADVRLLPVDRDGQPVKGVAVFPEWVRMMPPVPAP